MAADRGGHLGDGLRRVRRARDVGEHPARPERRDGGVDEFALEAGEVGEVRRRAAPPRLGATAERPEARTGGVEQDPVEVLGVVLADVPPVPHHHVDDVGVGADRALDEAGAVVEHLVGDQVGAALTRERREQGRLATGARAHVEPPVVRPLEGGVHGECGHELRTLVLDADPGARHAPQLSGRAPRDPDAPRRVPRGFRTRDLAEQAVAVGQARPCDEGDGGRDVVRPQEVPQFVPPSVEGEGLPEGADDPARVGLPGGEPVRPGEDLLLPVLQGPIGDAAEHGVGHGDGSRPGDHLHQVHGLVDGRPAGDAHRVDLVGAHP